MILSNHVSKIVETRELYSEVDERLLMKNLSEYVILDVANIVANKKHQPARKGHLIWPKRMSHYFASFCNS